LKLKILKFKILIFQSRVAGYSFINFLWQLSTCFFL